MDISKINEQKISETNISQAQKNQKNSGVTQKGDLASQATESTNKTKGAKYLDRLELSTDSEIAAEALETAKNSQLVRSDKVAALKSAIKNGTYKPDVKSVADSMIQKSLEDSLLTRKS